MPLGNLSKNDFINTLEELKRRGIGLTNVDREDLHQANNKSRDFLDYVQQVLTSPIINLPEAEAGVEFDRNELKKGRNEFLKTIWDRGAKSWAAVESPITYLATMQTLLQFLKTHPKKNERIISLGSGPGLYETYLGGIFQEAFGKNKVTLYPADFSKEMTSFNKKLLKISMSTNSNKIRNVFSVTEDMTNLTYPDKYFDQIICNNSLQWVPNWQKAISEMQRVINPKGLGYLYLFVNNNPMSVVTNENEQLMTLDNIELPDLLDTLEHYRFSILNTRQIKTAPGAGQRGRQTERLFIRARYREKGDFASWKSTNGQEASLSTIVTH